VSEKKRGKRRRECNRTPTLTLEDTEDLVASDGLDLSNTVRVAEGDANLRRSHTLAGKLDDLLGHFIGSGLYTFRFFNTHARKDHATRKNTATHLEPSWRVAPVGKGRVGNTLVGVVDPTHDVCRKTRSQF
jgi:hypothetical protein